MEAGGDGRGPGEGEADVGERGPTEEFGGEVGGVEFEADEELGGAAGDGGEIDGVFGADVGGIGEGMEELEGVFVGAGEDFDADAGVMAGEVFGAAGEFDVEAFKAVGWGVEGEVQYAGMLARGGVGDGEGGVAEEAGGDGGGAGGGFGEVGFGEELAVDVGGPGAGKVVEALGRGVEVGDGVVVGGVEALAEGVGGEDAEVVGGVVFALGVDGGVSAEGELVVDAGAFAERVGVPLAADAGAGGGTGLPERPGAVAQGVFVVAGGDHGLGVDVVGEGVGGGGRGGALDEAVDDAAGDELLIAEEVGGEPASFGEGEAVAGVEGDAVVFGGADGGGVEVGEEEVVAEAGVAAGPVDGFVVEADGEDEVGVALGGEFGVSPGEVGGGVAGAVGFEGVEFRIGERELGGVGPAVGDGEDHALVGVIPDDLLELGVAPLSAGRVAPPGVEADLDGEAGLLSDG